MITVLTYKKCLDEKSEEPHQADASNESEAEESEEQLEEEENEEDEDDFDEPDLKKSKFDMGSDLDDEGQGFFSDISNSRTISSRTYRYEKQLGFSDKNQIYRGVQLIRTMLIRHALRLLI